VKHGVEMQASLVVDGRLATDAKRLDEDQMARLHARARSEKQTDRPRQTETDRDRQTETERARKLTH